VKLAAADDKCRPLVSPGTTHTVAFSLPWLEMAWYWRLTVSDADDKQHEKTWFVIHGRLKRDLEKRKAAFAA
jgi:hypothetical protein